MRLSSLISLAVLALPILLHSPGALSAEPSKDISARCGATLSEALAAAEKALAVVRRGVNGADRRDKPLK